jgi:AcrR family transcriptional regulator
MSPRSQRERSLATRTALIDTARAMFAERGYANVPADEIVAAAGVTRGAMYHHFADKKALFEAVFLDFEANMTDELREVARAHEGWAGVAMALGHFLDMCERQDVRQIGLTDAPAVLGWQRWREIESEYGLGVVVEQLQQLEAAGELQPGAPVLVLAQLALSAVIEAALLIAHADDPGRAREQAQAGLLALLSGMIRRPDQPPAARLDSTP